MSGPDRKWRSSRLFFTGWGTGGLVTLCLALAGSGEEQAFDLFPMSKPWLDVRIPRFDEQDVLTSMMHTEALTRQGEKRLKMDGLTLVMFQSSGEISLRLKTKEGLYDVASSVLQTHSTTFIEHAQFEMTGDRMTFDTSKQRGTLQGNVEMRIFGVPVAPDGGPLPTSPRPAPALPRTQPAAGQQDVQPRPEPQNTETAVDSVEVVHVNTSALRLPKSSKP